MNKREAQKFNLQYSKFLETLQLQTHSWFTIKRDRYGLQRYFEYVLEIDWDWVLIVKPPIVKSLPDILSPDEINRVHIRLGHEDPRTITLYTQLTDAIQQDMQATVNRLVNQVTSPLSQDNKGDEQCSSPR